MIVVREFTFEAAHFLPDHPGRCRDLHGHGYRLEVWCAGPLDPQTGMVIDFADIKTIVTERVLERIDHTLLNDTIENPTAERVAAWIWDQLASTRLPLSEVRLHETANCLVIYRGPGTQG